MEDTNNNKRVAPPLKFSSMIKNHSFSTKSTTPNSRLSTPRALGSAPLLSKYQERRLLSSHSEKSATTTPKSASEVSNSDVKSKIQSSQLRDSNTEWSVLRSATAGSSWLRRPRSQPSLQVLNSDSELKLGKKSSLNSMWSDERKTASNLMLNRSLQNETPGRNYNSRAGESLTPNRGFLNDSTVMYFGSPSINNDMNHAESPKRNDGTRSKGAPRLESPCVTKSNSSSDLPLSFSVHKDSIIDNHDKMDKINSNGFQKSEEISQEMSYSRFRTPFSDHTSRSDFVKDEIRNGHTLSPLIQESYLSETNMEGVESKKSSSNGTVNTGDDKELFSRGTLIEKYDSDNSPSVTRHSSSSSSSSSSALMMALSQPTPSPRRKPRVSRRISHKPIILDDDEFIGFATLPDQVHRKAVKRGFEFSLMVVGETGLGKSTLINSLFLTDLYKERKTPNVEETVQRTVNIEKKQLEIEERGVKLRLTIVDTPGFNEAVNGEESWKPIVEYVDKQFDQYYQAESGLNRKNIQDARVHCCLYFVSPFGHGLKPIDVLVMKKLHHKVNIVPLLAKSDILTPKEVKRLKAKILEEIQSNKIQIYQFPDCDSDEDEEFKQQDKALKAAIPFAVVGSNTVVEAGGKKIRGRMYPWGIVEVDNPKHCDFGKLRQMLISTHMQDLKDITSDVHYENYRAEHLAAEMNRSQRERSKLKRDSAANLDAVMDTDKLLQQKEAEIQRMQAMLAKMQAQLQNSPSAQLNGKVSKP